MPTQWKPHVDLSQTIKKKEKNLPCVASLTHSTLPTLVLCHLLLEKEVQHEATERHQHVQHAGDRRDFAHLRVSMDADMHCPTATSDFRL